MKIHRLLKSELILLDMEEKDKEGVIKRLTERLKEQGLVADAEAFVGDVMKREALGSTAMGNGLAFPHARTKATENLILAFGRLLEPVAFSQEKDGKAVRMVFLLGTPLKETAAHLEVLTALGRLVADKKVRKGILSAKTPEAVLGGIATAESADEE